MCVYLHMHLHVVFMSLYAHTYVFPHIHIYRYMKHMYISGHGPANTSERLPRASEPPRTERAKLARSLLSAARPGPSSEHYTICVYAHVHIHAYICIHTLMYASLYLYMYALLSVLMCIHVCTHSCIHSPVVSHGQITARTRVLTTALWNFHTKCLKRRPRLDSEARTARLGQA